MSLQSRYLSQKHHDLCVEKSGQMTEVLGEDGLWSCDLVRNNAEIS
jgi:hypothetical protein